MKKLLLFLTIIISLNTLGQGLLGQRLLIPYRVDSLWGMINLFEKMIVKPIYEEIGLFSDQSMPLSAEISLARIKYKGRFGYLDSHCNEIIKPMYEEATNFSHGYAIVCKNGKEFTIDANNNIVHDSLYKEPVLLPNYTLESPSKILPPLEKHLWERKCIELECDEVYPIKNDIWGYIVKKNNRFGLVNFNDLKIPIEYDSISAYHDAGYITHLNNKKGIYVSFSGVESPTVSLPEYDEVIIVKRNNYSGFLYWYKKNDLWGFIDFKHNLIEPKYKSLDLCSERDFLYEVTTKDGKFGYYLISEMKECFTDKIPVTINELKPFFIEAEEYANTYIEKQLTNVNMLSLITNVDKCLQSAMVEKNNTRQKLYYNFCLVQGINFFKLDTIAMSETADLYYKSGLVSKKAINVSPILIDACAHFNTKFTDLINKYPDYPFSKIVKAFKTDVVNEISPSIINSAFSNVFEDFDFNKEFYQKVVLLYKFYLLVYIDLVHRGKIDKEFLKIIND